MSILLRVVRDTHCISILLAVEGIEHARPHCLWWIGIHPKRLHCGGVVTDTTGMSIVHTAGGGKGYTLQVHTRLLLVLCLLYMYTILILAGCVSFHLPTAF
jgi:hypothetical protein